MGSESRVRFVLAALAEVWRNSRGALLLFVLLIDLWLCAGIGVHSGVLPTSKVEFYPYPAPHRFWIEIEATGDTVFTKAEGISEELREEIMDRVYPSPEAAMLAAEQGGSLEAVGDWIGPKPAYAHAVKKCTKRDGVKSLDTGGGYHLTYHRFDRNGYRYTKTYHMVYSHPAPVATDVFYAKINKRYC